MIRFYTNAKKQLFAFRPRTDMPESEYQLDFMMGRIGALDVATLDSAEAFRWDRIVCVRDEAEMKNGQGPKITRELTDEEAIGAQMRAMNPI